MDPITPSATSPTAPTLDDLAPEILSTPSDEDAKRWRAGLHRFPKGDYLTEAGGAAEALYIVRSGHVRTFLLDARAEEVTTAILGPGQVIGIAALLGHPAWYSFAEALTPVEAWALPACYLAEQMRTHPDLQTFLLYALMRRLAFEASLLGDIALRPVGERAASVQQRLALVNGHPPRLTRSLIAELVGARRETVSRAGSRRRYADR
jgi:CRP-like cAMP-binding protein